MESTNDDCPNGCFKYRQSLEQVVEAGNKHKGKVISLKYLAEEQKVKISTLREDRDSLLDDVSKLESTEKDQRDIITRMTRETRELKIQLRDLRKEVIERDEVINEERRKILEVTEYKTKSKDLEDEILIKDQEIAELKEIVDTHVVKELPLQTSLEEELNLSAENTRKPLEDQCKEISKERIKYLERELKECKDKEASEKINRNVFFQRMDSLSEDRKLQIEKLKEKVKKLENKPFPACWYGIECRRLFCKFNHEHVFQKVNKSCTKPENQQSVFKDHLCDRCGQVFHGEESGIKHIKTCHEDIFPNLLKTFKCRECSFDFRTRSDLNAHVIENHNEIEFECEVCGKFFVSRSELNNHRMSHEDSGNDIAALNDMLKGLLDKHEEVSNVKECIELERPRSAFKCEK